MKTAFIGAAALGLAFAGAASAQTFTETGDAGQTVATAQSTGSGSSPLTSISGSLDSTYDADLFRIYISNPSTFSATTLNAATDASLDTELFLLTATGAGIAANNDDQSGFYLDSTLPAGNALYANLSAGYYLLGISNSGNEPVNSANQLIFGNPPADTTSVRGPATGLNPTTMVDFNGNVDDPTDDGPGSYRIDLTGVTQGQAAVSAAPEPGTWALMLLGMGLCGRAIRRRRAAGSATFAI